MGQHQIRRTSALAAFSSLLIILAPATAGAAPIKYAQIRSLFKNIPVDGGQPISGVMAFPQIIGTAAKLSADVYGPDQGADGYQLKGSIGGTGGNLGFGANVYQNGSQIEIAVRGTDFANPLARDSNTGYNILADFSFLGNYPDPVLNANVGQLAALLQAVHTANPTAEITLTGHSLGGALAQIVGQAAGVQVLSYNAPGPGSLIAALSNELSGLRDLNISTPSPAITNYRLYGDQASLVGKQLAPSMHEQTTHLICG